MRKVHPLVNGHVVYVYWIDTVYVQNNLPSEFSKRTITTNGLRKGSLLVLIILLNWLKYFQESTPKIQMLMSAHPDVTFWAVGYHSPLVLTSFSHILCKI